MDAHTLYFNLFDGLVGSVANGNIHFNGFTMVVGLEGQYTVDSNSNNTTHYQYTGH